MYTQVRGTAMGTKFAPTYATLVLAHLEEKLYVQTEIKSGKTLLDISKITGNGFWMTVSFYGLKEKKI